MLFRRKIWRTATALIILALATVAASISAPTSRADNTVTLTPMVWNIAGSHASFAGGVELMQAVHQEINRTGADVVVLNEICTGQYKLLQKALQQQGWPHDRGNFSRLQVMGTHTGCKGTTAQQKVGMAIFSKRPFTAGLSSHQLFPPDPVFGDRKHFVSCATDKAQRRLRLCFTHISAVADKYAGQAETAVWHLKQYAEAGNAVMVAGDFNIQPHEPQLDSLYHGSVDTENNGNNTGLYRELDDTDAFCRGYGAITKATRGRGEPPPCLGSGDVAKKKIDMIFVNHSKIRGTYRATVEPIPRCNGTESRPLCSDHHAVTGRVTLEVPS